MKEQLRARIAFLVNDLQDIMIVINRGYTVASQIDEEELKRIYYQELLPFVYDFDKVAKELKATLEAYFIEEKIHGLPIDFNLHKLYRKMNDEQKIKWFLSHSSVGNRNSSRTSATPQRYNHLWTMFR